MRPRGRFAYPFMNEKMAEHGWVVTGVPGKAIYTVGLMERGHPELGIHGLAPEHAHSLLIVAVQNVFAGYRFEPGIHDNIAEGRPAKLIEVHQSNFMDWFGQALGYHRQWSLDPLKIRQILWCDTENRFPDDPLYDRRFGQLMFDVRRPEYEW